MRERTENVLFEVTISYKKKEGSNASFQSVNYFRRIESAKKFIEEMIFVNKENVEKAIVRRINKKIIGSYE